MQLRYALDEKPPLKETLLFGLQWFAVAIPAVIIIGRVVGHLQFPDPAGQAFYLQKTCFLVALTLFSQVLFGHRLPLIAGPSTVLLIGVVASQDSGLDTIYSSIGLGGLVLAGVSATGLFAHVRRLFTPRVVAVVLLLIAFTLSPTVMRLITSPETGILPLSNLCFALVLVTLMFLAQRWLTGIWKSTLIIWGLLVGSVAYALIFPLAAVASSGPWIGGFWKDITTGFSLRPGVLISFLFCFLALSINDLGSIESMSELIRPGRMEQRINRGITLTGLANILSGFLGVVGPVNFSLSPGVILSTGCASRWTLLPTATLFFLLSFSPASLGIIGNVAPVVTGVMLLYILVFQIAAGLMVIFREGVVFTLENGLVLGLPLLLGTIVSFLPPAVSSTFPAVLRPLMGNGFVVGVASAFFLEHVVFSSQLGKPGK
jgi:xanthine/uracil permease